MNSRKFARLTIAQVVGSVVITDAERGLPSSDISPTYSPGPWKAITTSRPAALLAKTKSPSESEIRAALADNLCRCGTHQRIVAAVKRAAAA